MKTGSKENGHMKDKEKNPAEIANQIMKNYEQAVQTSLKIQEEAVKCCNRVFNQAALSQEWQKRLTSFADTTNGFLPEAQKRAEEVLDLVEKGTRTGADLMAKAVEAVQAPAMADSQTKWLEFWTASMSAVQTNTEAMAQIQNRAMDSWVGLVRQNVEPVRAAKAAA